MSSYPSSTDISKIKKWPINRFEDCIGLLEFVGQIWAYSEWGYKRKGRTFWLSTAGWSGNEEIVTAMTLNRLFWLFSWYSSRKGGHFVFKVSKSA